MAELILTSEEARRYVELIGPVIKTSKIFEPIFPSRSSDIALIRHTAEGDGERYDVIFIVRKTKNGIDGRKILDANNLICMPAKKKYLHVLSTGIISDILRLEVSFYAEYKAEFRFKGEYKCLMSLNDLFAV